MNCKCENKNILYEKRGTRWHAYNTSCGRHTELLNTVARTSYTRRRRRRRNNVYTCSCALPPFYFYYYIFQRSAHYLLADNRVWQFLENFPRKSRSQNHIYTPYLLLLSFRLSAKDLGNTPDTQFSDLQRVNCGVRIIDLLRQSFIVTSIHYHIFLY